MLGAGPALNCDRGGRLPIFGIGFHQWRSTSFDMGVRGKSFFSQSNGTVQMQVQVLPLQASWLSRLIPLFSCYHRSRLGKSINLKTPIPAIRPFPEQSTAIK